MIAMKRRLPLVGKSKAESPKAGFSWSECQRRVSKKASLEKLATSHCTNYDFCQRADKRVKIGAYVALEKRYEKSSIASHIFFEKGYDTHG